MPKILLVLGTTALRFDAAHGRKQSTGSICLVNMRSMKACLKSAAAA
jgi:hypothetical protein